MTDLNAGDKATARIVFGILVIFLGVLLTIYTVWVISVFQIAGSFLWPYIWQTFVGITEFIIAVYILYSLPRWLGRLVDHFSTKKGSERAINQAIGEYRLNQLREEGKKMDGQMYYQQKGY